MLVAEVSWRWRQVLPPSREAESTIGCGGPPTLRKAVLQTYTLPKKRLDAALSAQMSSLSVSSAAFWRLTMTGSIQALWTPAAAAATLSVRDTAAAEAPVNGVWPVSGKARLA